MRREPKIVIGTLALGCILGLVLWLVGSEVEPAPMGTGTTKAVAQREPVTGAKREAPGPPRITTDPFEPAPAQPTRTCVTGRVRDVNGALAFGALVSLGRSIMKEGEESVAEWTEVWADSEGRYRFSATPGWRVRLWADSRSSIVTLLPAFEVQEGTNLLEDIRLCAGATVSGWIRSQTGEAVKNTTLEIKTFFPVGTVPKELHSILLRPYPLGPVSLGHVITDQEGRYWVGDLHPACKVRISVHHPTLVARQGALEVPAGAGGVNFDLEGSPLMKIRGRVAGVDAADLLGIMVKIWHGSKPARGSFDVSSVDATGAFEIHLKSGTTGVIRAVCIHGRYWPSDDLEIRVGRTEIHRSIQLVLRKR